MSHPRSSASAPRQLYAARPDADLLAGMRDDDDGRAFAELYERYWLPLLKETYRRLDSREAAEEVVQEVFVSLWQKRRELVVESLPAYLRAAIRYRVIDVLKARQPRQQYEQYARHHAPCADHGTEETVAVADLSGALLRSLPQLPDHTREVFRLSRLEHQSVPEIAARLNVSRKTVEYHLTRALKSLRVSLGDFLGWGALVLALLGAGAG